MKATKAKPLAPKPSTLLNVEMLAGSIARVLAPMLQRERVEIRGLDPASDPLIAKARELFGGDAERSQAGSPARQAGSLPSPIPVPSLETELNYNDAAVNALHETISHLESALETILEPSNPNACATGGPTEASPPTAAAVCRVQGLTSGVHVARQRISSLLNRIQLSSR